MIINALSTKIHHNRCRSDGQTVGVRIRRRRSSGLLLISRRCRFFSCGRLFSRCVIFVREIECHPHAAQLPLPSHVVSDGFEVMGVFACPIAGHLHIEETNLKRVYRSSKNNSKSTLVVFHSVNCCIRIKIRRDFEHCFQSQGFCNRFEILSWVSMTNSRNRTQESATVADSTNSLLKIGDCCRSIP
uniref:Uncharacterized protein n=1 Tax=Romanomermis culicivorax TaxID=13658 RepID=A0A915KXU3_ROMCU